jgi:hypothetical protein
VATTASRPKTPGAAEADGAADAEAGAVAELDADAEGVELCAVSPSSSPPRRTTASTVARMARSTTPMIIGQGVGRRREPTGC